MRSVYEERVENARQIERRLRQGTAEIVSVQKFGIVCKALWPFKTAAHLASIAGTNERTAARWLSGEFEPPGILIAAIIVEITDRGNKGNGQGRGLQKTLRHHGAMGTDADK